MDDARPESTGANMFFIFIAFTVGLLIGAASTKIKCPACQSYDDPDQGP